MDRQLKHVPPKPFITRDIIDHVLFFKKTYTDIEMFFFLLESIIPLTEDAYISG